MPFLWMNRTDRLHEIRDKGGGGGGGCKRFKSLVDVLYGGSLPSRAKAEDDGATPTCSPAKLTTTRRTDFCCSFSPSISQKMNAAAMAVVSALVPPPLSGAVHISSQKVE